MTSNDSGPHIFPSPGVQAEYVNEMDYHSYDNFALQWQRFADVIKISDQFDL